MWRAFSFLLYEPLGPRPKNQKHRNVRHPLTRGHTVDVSPNMGVQGVPIAPDAGFGGKYLPGGPPPMPGMPGMGGGPPGRYLPPKPASGAMGTPWTPMLGDTSTVCPRVNGCRTFRCFWFLGRGPNGSYSKKLNARHTSLVSA